MNDRPFASRQVACASPAETGRISIETGDADEFVALVNRMFGHHRILSMEGTWDLGSVHGQRCGSLLVGQLQYGGDVHVEVDEPRLGWVVTHARGHDGSWDSRRFVDGDLMMYPPEWCGHLEMARGTQMRNTYLPRLALTEALCGLLGAEPDAPVVFAPRMAADGVAAHRLRALIDLMYSADSAAPAFTSLLQQAWQRTFAMELLTVWPNSYSRHLARVAPLPRALRRACEYIDAHLGEPIAMADLGRAASVGVRSLELGFARQFGCSPTRYIRDRRLDAARHDLQHGVGYRVADIALKWCFSNPGQFAKVYRERFGELPGRALASRRSS